MSKIVLESKSNVGSKLKTIFHLKVHVVGKMLFAKLNAKLFFLNCLIANLRSNFARCYLIITWSRNFNWFYVT